MTQRFQSQDAASELAQHLHRFTLHGAPGSLEFPPLCPNCGAAAAARVVCSKVFRRTHTDAPTEHRVTSVAVPFCAECIASHRRQSTPLTPWDKVLASFATGDMLGALFPGIAALFVSYLALKALVRGQLTTLAVMLAVAGFFGLIAWSQRRAVWAETEHLRVVRQSPVSIAFDFSDDIAPTFEPPRFICTVRDARFAAAFEALNRSHQWVAGSPQDVAGRRAASRQTWVIGSIVAAVALVMMIADCSG